MACATERIRTDGSSPPIYLRNYVWKDGDARRLRGIWPPDGVVTRWHGQVDGGIERTPVDTPLRHISMRALVISPHGADLDLVATAGRVGIDDQAAHIRANIHHHWRRMRPLMMRLAHVCSSFALHI